MPEKGDFIAQSNFNRHALRLPKFPFHQATKTSEVIKKAGNPKITGLNVER